MSQFFKIEAVIARCGFRRVTDENPRATITGRSGGDRAGALHGTPSD
jgi:hypothetical protein